MGYNCGWKHIHSTHDQLKKKWYKIWHEYTLYKFYKKVKKNEKSFGDLNNRLADQDCVLQKNLRLTSKFINAHNS